jgi:hypothetical protein
MPEGDHCAQLRGAVETLEVTLEFGMSDIESEPIGEG